MQQLAKKVEAKLKQALFADSGRLPSQERRERYLRCRRVIDVAVAAVILPLCIPVFLVIWVLVRLDSSGPGFFIQERPGQHGKVFRLYKFRSMTNIHEPEEFVPAAKRQEITRIGTFLRRSKLDELPQLLNIFLGDMSLIGPRPQPLSHARRWSQTIPNYAQRFQVPAGLSGAAQILQGSTTSQAQEEIKLVYDLAYIQACSWRVDLMILTLTIFSMCGLYHAGAAVEHTEDLYGHPD
jgi:lipopolysaccharide/colanic/teichoic acid biosynthesis glycosyltransferase